MAHTAGLELHDDAQAQASPAAAGLEAAGAQLAVGDFTDRDALTAALRGAVVAFALTTPFEPGAAAELEQGQAIIEAAIAARLPHLVFSSVAGATTGTGVPHFESKAAVERTLAGSGLPTRLWRIHLRLRQRPRGYQDLLHSAGTAPSA